MKNWLSNETGVWGLTRSKKGKLIHSAERRQAIAKINGFVSQLTDSINKRPKAPEHNRSASAVITRFISDINMAVLITVSAVSSVAIVSKYDPSEIAASLGTFTATPTAPRVFSFGPFNPGVGPAVPNVSPEPADSISRTCPEITIFPNSNDTKPNFDDIDIPTPESSRPEEMME